MPVTSSQAISSTPLSKEFSLTRVLHAPLEMVWKAWTDVDSLAKWWGPAGLEMISVKLDLRPGGLFHYGMRGPDGKVMWGKFVFREIVPKQKLAYVVSFSDENGGAQRHPMAAGWPLDILCTILFTEKEGQTILAMTGIAINATEAERALFEGGFAGMEQGFGGTFLQLDAFLASSRGKDLVQYPNDTEMVFTRVVDGPVEMVYKAWTEPDRVAKWWGPKGFTNTIHEMDVRVGGVWRLDMHGPDGTSYPNLIQYTEVVKNESLKWMHGLPDQPPLFHAEVKFIAQGNKTKIIHRMICGSAEQCAMVKGYGIDGHREGWDRLEAELAITQEAR